MLKNLILFTCLKIIFIACDSDNHIRTYRLPKNIIKKDNVLNNISQNKIEFGWEKPTDWKEVVGHSMRLASFEAPFSGGMGDVSITIFSGESGGIAPNVNRWLGQIGLEPMANSDIQKIAQEKVGRLGDYSYFKLINPLDGSSAILASIYQLKNRTLFVKLSTSIYGLNEIEEDFNSFCVSIFKQDE